MFEKLFDYQSVQARHRNAPFAQEREAYLSHRAGQGSAKGTLLNIARELLVVCRYLHVLPHQEIDPAEIEVAAHRWARRQRRRHRAQSLRWSQALFILRATQWLRFLGLLKQPKENPAPLSNLVEDFASFCSRDRGLSPVTVRDYCWHVRDFLSWWNAQGRPFTAVSVRDVDAYISFRSAGRWTRVSVASCAKSLKAFFIHAERRSWCHPGVAAAIQSPRIFRQEGLPGGPVWSDVQKLIATTDSDRPRDIRDRCMLMFFAIYALRSGEVARLRLEDFDWEQETLTVWRPKQRRTQQYPLVQEVGYAVIRYLRDVRPACARREMFLALKAPYRPLSPGALYHLTQTRFTRLGIVTPRRGPHALRHACAAWLLAQGASLKEIGDHLGHRSSFATRTYAKVDLAGLREVAAFDLGGLL
jgi:site-specific recombinase XerD